jgi:hypothetical protein
LNFLLKFCQTTRMWKSKSYGSIQFLFPILNLKQFYFFIYSDQVIEWLQHFEIVSDRAKSVTDTNTYNGLYKKKSWILLHKSALKIAKTNQKYVKFSTASVLICSALLELRLNCITLNCNALLELWENRNPLIELRQHFLNCGCITWIAVELHWIAILNISAAKFQSIIPLAVSSESNKQNVTTL